MNSKALYTLEFDKILELGSGTGILTQEIIQNFKFKKYLANDFVTKSKKFIDKIYPENIFICGNAQKIRPNCKVNLVISNAMFQWFRSIDTSHFAGMLEKGGILAFTTFSPQNFKEIRDITGLSLKYKTTEELKKELENNFEILYIEEYTETIKFQTALELLAHMKNTGVNSLSQTKWAFKEVKEFCDIFTKKYPEITLTYAPIMVVCRKK